VVRGFFGVFSALTFSVFFLLRLLDSGTTELLVRTDA